MMREYPGIVPSSIRCTSTLGPFTGMDMGPQEVLIGDSRTHFGQIRIHLIQPSVLVGRADQLNTYLAYLYTVEPLYKGYIGTS